MKDLFFETHSRVCAAADPALVVSLSGGSDFVLDGFLSVLVGLFYDWACL